MKMKHFVATIYLHSLLEIKLNQLLHILSFDIQPMFVKLIEINEQEKRARNNKINIIVKDLNLEQNNIVNYNYMWIPQDIYM